MNHGKFAEILWSFAMSNRFVNQERNSEQLQAFVAQLTGKGRMGFAGLVHPMTVRLPVDVFAYTEALAKHGNITRNQVAHELMAQGLSVVLSQLDEATAAQIADKAADVLVILFPDMKASDAVESLSYGMES